MIVIMRTTVSISDDLLAAARVRARQTGQTLGSLVEAALRRELSVQTHHAEAPDVPVFRGTGGPRPGIDLTSNAALFESLDDGLPLDERR